MVLRIDVRVRTNRTIGQMNKIIFNLPKMTIRGAEELSREIVRRAQMLIRNEAIYQGRHGQLVAGFRILRTGDKRKANFSVINIAHDEKGRIYSKFVELGTKPHFIEGGLGFVPGVMHPGAVPRHYLGRAAQQVRNITRQRIDKALSKAIRGGR